MMQPPLSITILEVFLLENNKNKVNCHSLFNLSFGHFCTAGQQKPSVNKGHSQSCHKMICETQTHQLTCMIFPGPSHLEVLSGILNPGWDDLSRTLLLHIKTLE